MEKGFYYGYNTSHDQWTILSIAYNVLKLHSFVKRFLSQDEHFFIER